MEHQNAWKTYSDDELAKVDELAARYIDFISDNKIEREIAAAAIKEAEDAGYVSLDELIENGGHLKAGDKVWAHTHGKALILVHLGTEPLEHGLNILGAHIDSPRLDLKQNPLYESTDLAFLDTHYYGGIKKYQWVTLPLAIHGVIAKTDGAVVPVTVGEDPSDPVFVVTDLLIHLAQEQMKKDASKVVEGEALDLLVGGKPLVLDADASKDADGDDDRPAWEKLAEKEPVKANVLKILAEKYDVAEEDFLSAELEVVPAGRARELGFDRSMVLGYGHDDRVCAYPALMAALDCLNPSYTTVTVLTDKEEIGSVGNTGLSSAYLQFFIEDLAKTQGLEGRDVLRASECLSADVNAGVDPTFQSVHDKLNASFINRGIVVTKYTGARGKSGTSDASAELVSYLTGLMDANSVVWQIGEMGKLDLGGGGTVAKYVANQDIDTIDIGVPVLSMHSPFEIVSKADVYMAYLTFKAFCEDAE